jgi:hypothetical protein
MDWFGNKKMGSPTICPVCKKDVKGATPYYKYLMPEFNKLKKKVEEIPINQEEEVLKNKEDILKKENNKKKKEKKKEPHLTEEELLNQAIESIQQTTIFDDKNIPGVNRDTINQIDDYLYTYFKTLVKPAIKRLKNIPEKAEMVRQLEFMLEAYNILTNKHKSNEEKKQELNVLNDIRLYVVTLELDLVINSLMYRYQMYEPNLIYAYFEPTYYTNYINTLTQTEQDNASKKSEFFYKQKIILFYPNHTLTEKKNAEKILKQLITKPFYLNPMIEMYLQIFKTQVQEEVDDPHSIQTAGKKRKSTKKRNKRTHQKTHKRKIRK